MHSNNLKGILVFVVALLVGWQISVHSWDGLVYFVLDDDRQPAAVARNFDLSHLQGEALQVAAHKRLLKEASFIKGEQGLGVQLGHFLARDAEGNKKLACQIYEKVEMTFTAEEMAENGEPPVMIVEGPCSINKQDINHISAIWIPVDKIVSEKPGDLELSFYEGSQVNLKFDHIGSQWPSKWVLLNVRLFSPNNPHLETLIDENQVREVLPHALEMIW